MTDNRPIIRALINNLLDIDNEMRFLTYSFYTSMSFPIADAVAASEIYKSGHPFAIRFQAVADRRAEVLQELFQAIDEPG